MTLAQLHRKFVQLHKLRDTFILSKYLIILINKKE